MGRTKSAKLGSLVEKFILEVLRSGKNWEDRQITTEDVNRPGLQLTGFFDYFGEERLQVIGLVETSYLEGRTAQERRTPLTSCSSTTSPRSSSPGGLSHTGSVWKWRKSMTGPCCGPGKPPRNL